MFVDVQLVNVYISRYNIRRDLHVAILPHGDENNGRDSEVPSRSMSYFRGRILAERDIENVPHGSGRKRRMDPAAKNSQPMRRAKNEKEWGSLKKRNQHGKKGSCDHLLSHPLFSLQHLFPSDCSLLSLVFSLPRFWLAVIVVPLR